MRTRLAVAVSGLALVAFSASAAGAAPLSPGQLAPARAAAAGPRVTLSPASGPPATTVAVSGSGFGAYEGVDLYFGTTDLALAGTGRTGSFGPVSIHIPASAIPGTAWVSAEGRRSRLFAQTPFTVRTNWDQFHFSANHEGVNPYENVLSPATVSGLDVNWIFATGNLVSSPAVANGVVYVGSNDGKVFALNAAPARPRPGYLHPDYGLREQRRVLHPQGFRCWRWRRAGCARACRCGKCHRTALLPEGGDGQWRPRRPRDFLPLPACPSRRRCRSAPALPLS